MRNQTFIDQRLCKISEIMSKNKWPKAAILDFIRAKFVMGYLCVRPYIFLDIHRRYSYFPFFSYVNITKLLKLKKAAKRPF